ncbi:MAG: hypothetical protein ACKO45_07355 [Cyanobium sp.]
MLALCGALLMLLTLGTGGVSKAEAPLQTSRLGSYIPISSPPAGAEQVEIGFSR